MLNATAAGTGFIAGHCIEQLLKSGYVCIH